MMAEGAIRGIEHGVTGKRGFNRGYHAWKVKVIQGSMCGVGVHCVNPGDYDQCDNYWLPLGNIGLFSAGSICSAYLDCESNTLTIQHLPSGQKRMSSLDHLTLRLEDYNLFPCFGLSGKSAITLCF